MENPADWFLDVLAGVVKNPQKPQFKPAMLFDLWKEGGESFVASFRPERRALTSDDTDALVERAVDDVWKGFDGDGDGVMNKQEFANLLAVCLKLDPGER